MKKIIAIVFIISIFLIGLNYKSIKTSILKMIYKIDYAEYVEKYSKEYDVDKYLVYATIKAESNFNRYAKSSQGAFGLMQLLQSTAEEIAPKVGIEVNESNIFEPDVNINLGTKFLSILLEKYENIGLALAAYNAGSGNVDNWINKGTLKNDGSDIENIPFKETNNYARKILRDYDIYKELYE